MLLMSLAHPLIQPLFYLALNKIHDECMIERHELLSSLLLFVGVVEKESLLALLISAAVMTLLCLFCLLEVHIGTKAEAAAFRVGVIALLARQAVAVKGEAAWLNGHASISSFLLVLALLFIFALPSIRFFLNKKSLYERRHLAAFT